MGKYDFLRARGESTVLDVHVQPRASKTEIVGIYKGFLKLRLRALPADGEANRECLKFLSKILKVPRGNLEIIQGEKSRQKSIRIEERGVDEVEACLDALL